MFSQFCEFSGSGLGAGRWSARRAAALVSLAMVWPAWAGVEDDYRAAEGMYLRGDIIGAMPVLRTGADKGHAPSQVLLAEILDRAEFNEEALGYYRKAAEQGSAAGEFGLGTMYEAGEGVKKDPQQAYFWYTRSAERGHEPAIIALAAAHIAAMRGKATAPADGERAGLWILKAAEFNYPPAIEALAIAYRDGGFGLQPDAARAAEFAARVAALKKKSGTEARKGKR